MAYFALLYLGNGTTDMRVVDRTAPVTEDVLGMRIPPHKKATFVYGCAPRDARQIANKIRSWSAERRVALFHEGSAKLGFGNDKEQSNSRMKK